MEWRSNGAVEIRDDELYDSRRKSSLATGLMYNNTTEY